MEIHLKTSRTLDSDEITGLQQLMLAYWENHDSNYVKNKIVNGPNMDIVMVKNKEEVLGCNLYKLHKLANPFTERETPIFTFAVAYKKKGFRGNILWRLGSWYARKNLGPFWFLRSVIGVSIISSPKVFENFSTLFPLVYPTIDKETPSQVATFLQTYLNDYRNVPYELDDSCCYEYPYLESCDVTDHWEKHLKAKDETINEFFFERGIYIKKNQRIFRGEKILVACGYRSLRLVLKDILANIFYKRVK